MVRKSPAAMSMACAAPEGLPWNGLRRGRAGGSNVMLWRRSGGSVAPHQLHLARRQSLAWARGGDRLGWGRSGLWLGGKRASVARAKLHPPGELASGAKVFRADP